MLWYSIVLTRHYGARLAEANNPIIVTLCFKLWELPSSKYRTPKVTVGRIVNFYTAINAIKVSNVSLE